VTGVRGSAIGEAIENYANVAKGEVEKWRDYAIQVATNMDAEDGYKADAAASDLAAGFSRSIQSGANLTLGAMDAMLLMAGRLDEPYDVRSDEFTSPLPGAALKLKGDLTGLAFELPKDAVDIDPEQLGSGETKFRLCIADATGYEPDYYEGTVEASTTDGQTVDVPVEIIVA
jgi:hypothetical protein